MSVNRPSAMVGKIPQGIYDEGIREIVRLNAYAQLATQLFSVVARKSFEAAQKWEAAPSDLVKEERSVRALFTATLVKKKVEALQKELGKKTYEIIVRKKEKVIPLAEALYQDPADQVDFIKRVAEVFLNRSCQQFSRTFITRSEGLACGSGYQF